ncbi:MAG: hypothetical protein ACTSQJ_18870 [Promethearchaeota archaeon]
MNNDLDKRIEEIKEKSLLGKIKLLDFKLVPIFEDLKKLINIENLNDSSKTYTKACELLDKKFEELKILLGSFDCEQKFSQYIKNNPTEIEISHLLSDCWIKTFTIEALSLDYLEYCKNKLCGLKRIPISIEHLNKISVNEDFFLEIPKHKFTEKMMIYFENIKEKLPCVFDEIFENEKDQIKIYEKFVYILHLLQLGKIKYQKETNFLYI